MSEYSFISFSTIPQKNADEGGYCIHITIATRGGGTKNDSYAFPKRRHPFLLFIEFKGQNRNGEERNILIKLGNDTGDRKSYDMFLLFKTLKADLVKNKWIAIVYKKSLFQDDFENFQGFYPFGFTLVQPSFGPVLGIGDFNYSVDLSNEACPSLKIYNHTFNEVRIYEDIVTRKTVWSKTFESDS